MARRLALLIATSSYQDEGIRRLTTPSTDAEVLAGILRDPGVAGFEVTTLVDEPHDRVGAAIDDLYRARARDDLTLLYVTGHALLDDGGQIHLATTDTRRADLAATAVATSRVHHAMAASASQQTVLVLDCWYGGVFGPEHPVEVGATIGVLQRFGGRGRAVLTASDTLQYVFEGDRLHGTAEGSAFTRHLVEGLRDGSADLDGDGDIALDELYEHVRARVVGERPRQQPEMRDDIEGRLVLARNVHWTLPVELTAEPATAASGSPTSPVPVPSVPLPSGPAPGPPTPPSVAKPWAALDPAGPPATVVGDQVPPPPPPPPPPGFAPPTWSPTPPPSGAWLGATSPGRPSPWTSPTRLGILAVAVILVVVAAAVILTRDSGDEVSSAGRETPDLTIHRDPTDSTETTAPTETTSDDGDLGPSGAVDPQIAAASAIGTADPSCRAETDGVLRIGELLPRTGDLSFLYPPMSAGAAIAVGEINAAGGVLGQPVEYLPGDSGDVSPPIAGGTVDGHLQAGADMILGAAASGISLDVIDTVTGACTVQFSPSATSPAFLDYGDDDLFFRTAPSDVLQGRVVADLAIADGVTSMAVLYRQDTYGRGLDVFFRTFYEDQGGEIVADRGYDPESQDHSTHVNEVLASNPDGLVLIGFDESARILRGLFEQGFTPDQKRIYLVDGNTGNALGDEFADQPGALEGVTGTYTAAELTNEFYQQMLDHDPDLIDFLYGPESYDAVVITALAAESARTDRADEVARHINSVTRDGTECTGYVECRDLLAAGEDIDYTGLSGPLDFSQPGEPTTGSFAVETFGPDNRLDPNLTEYVFASL